ncbi:MAG: type IV toxin-antitoxin system AbiEi family antitoxin domain-containing protein [Solirubrobacterales bacterium]
MPEGASEEGRRGEAVRPGMATVLGLAARQHGVVSRTQLRGLGLSARAIAHRVGRGRLHPVWRGVFAVGRPGLDESGRWMAAVLACGRGAFLSHRSAGALWGVREWRGPIEVTVPQDRNPRPPGILVHRRFTVGPVIRDGIPVTAPADTLVDLAAVLGEAQLEAAVNEADRLGLVDPESLATHLDRIPRRPGLGALRRLLERGSFSLTDSELERRFLRLVRAAGLPEPQTGVRLNGFRVDFHWPQLGLVVETDGLRYHRTAAQQARDRLRDQAHVMAGLRALRFTHSQVAHRPEYVRSVLVATVRRCGP